MELELLAAVCVEGPPGLLTKQLCFVVTERASTASPFWVSVWSVPRAIKSRKPVTPELWIGIACTFPVLPHWTIVNQIHSKAAVPMRAHLAPQWNNHHLSPGLKTTSVRQAVGSASEIPQPVLSGILCTPWLLSLNFYLNIHTLRLPMVLIRKEKKSTTPDLTDCPIHSASRLSP